MCTVAEEKKMIKVSKIVERNILFQVCFDEYNIPCVLKEIYWCSFCAVYASLKLNISK